MRAGWQLPETGATPMAKKPPSNVIYRSAVSGRIVTPQYAKAHPKTTEKEHRPAPKKRPR
jgi:hypothetical protein